MPRLTAFAYGFEPYGVPLIPDGWREQTEAAQAVLDAAARRIEALLGTSGANGDVGILSCDRVTLTAIIARRAATCDAVMVSSDLRADEDLSRNAVHGSLVQSPVGVVLNGTDARYPPARPHIRRVGYRSSGGPRRPCRTSPSDGGRRTDDRHLRPGHVTAW